MEGGIWLAMGCDCDPMDNDAMVFAYKKGLTNVSCKGDSIKRRYGWRLRVKRLKAAFCKTPDALIHLSTSYHCLNHCSANTFTS